MAALILFTTMTLRTPSSNPGPKADEIKLTKNAYAVINSFNRLKEIAKQQNDRLLFIVHKEMGQLNVEDENARFSYCDIETGHSTNRDAIASWIYDRHKSTETSKNAKILDALGYDILGRRKNGL